MSVDVRAILEESRRKLDHLRSFFDLDAKRSSIEKLEREMAAADFWDDPDAARKRIQALKGSRTQVERWDQLERLHSDLETMIELSEEEEASESQARSEGEAIARKLERELGTFELTSFFAGELDSHDAVLSIHPGAGGTESQDWAEMLLRMYLRWAEENGFKVSMLDYQEGEEAGIKDATIEVQGDYAYGYLQAEAGVQRLVRISPYDAAKRRHTSFASVFVLPQVDELTDVEIRDEELRVDTYRASGAGGQHVNKTDSAVRITHLPTGIVVQSQAERSQHRNRDHAMRILRARLYQHYREEERKKLGHLEEGKREIAFGSQIRSYVFHPYTMVKDHRTGCETSDVQGVMDGDLNPFIDTWLRTRSRPADRADRTKKEA
ncbi:MAG: peptide chain release factor 2 [Candidatus Eisenbacteria bacterium]|nr:peptide chain release factor 2 [Candidatus Latescibacterota bacterium]MBD3303177.1 peptide chain release factor 2 [Candidatus Eisenbacteria bacterium]